MWRCVHRAGDDGGLMWMADVDRSSQDARESLSSTPRAPVGDQAHWLYRSRRELLASGLLAAASAVVPVLGIPQVRLMPWYGTRSLSVRSGKSCFSLGSAPGDGSREPCLRCPFPIQSISRRGPEIRGTQATRSHQMLPPPLSKPCTRQGPARAGGQGCGCSDVQARASSLPPAVDRAWEKIGGGPADLTFPDAFIGAWVVNSKLFKVDLPMGMDVLPSALVSRLPPVFCSSCMHMCHSRMVALAA